MAFGGGIGLEVEPMDATQCFAETPSRYILEVHPEQLEELQQHFGAIPCSVIGTLVDTNNITCGDLQWSLEDLFNAWSTGMVV
jgi:phosphoribosylformylglycinamidine (FGAM) synthase-like enzyme